MTEAVDTSALLTSIDELPALPLTVGRLASIIAAGDHDVREIVEVVSLDQSLTADILRRANSASSSARSQVATVKDAVVRLGTGPLLSMAFAATVGGQLNRPLPGYRMEQGELWRQSVAASLAAEVVRALATVDVPAEAPTAALLHDFGKVVLSQQFGPQVLRMVSQASDSELQALTETESALFGVNHAEVGGVVAARWRLPRTIVDAIMHHHDTGPGNTPIAAAVSLAHAMVPEVLARPEPRSARAETAGTPAVPGQRAASRPVETHVDVLATLGIPTEEYDPLVAAARARYTDLAARYSLS